MPARQITDEEVAKHTERGDLWIIIDTKVYDLSKFAALHPGGASVLLEDDVRGQDATEIFYSLHKAEVLRRPQYARLQIGVVPGAVESFAPAPLGSLSQVPYAEPQWLTKGYSSPYYTENHKAFQKAVRKWLEEFYFPEARECEATGRKISHELCLEMGKNNLNAMRVGTGKHLKGRSLMGGLVDPDKFDYFHEMIIHAEMSRAGQRGFNDGSLAGMVIGIPTLLNFGGPSVQPIVKQVLAGEKYLSLAITEAFAGSDVAGLRCTAKKTQDGKHWIINGTKKWITNGHFSDYFSTACRTNKGLTMILIPRIEGVATKPIKTSYSSTAGTAFVTFDNVRVPVENTLGKENEGLKVVLSNFNHERWMMTVNANQLQRNIVDESLRWASQRKAFGKPLIELAVVRAKLAQMISRVESGQTWIEHITYQMCNMSYAEQSKYLAGPIGLLKQHVTRAGQDTARDATQIFGGRGITQTGLGSSVEHFHRTITFDAILGGTEDVLADLGVKQAQKYMPKNARL